MTIEAKPKDEFRWIVALNGPETFADDFGFIGSWVGPRKGPDKRSHGQKEDYVLRRLLVAWREAGRLMFPLTVTAETERDGEPDFALTLPNGEILGVEVTEAGEENYQAWLTRTEDESDADGAILMPGDGIVPRVETENVAREIRDKIRKKVAAYSDHKKYRGPSACDLVVYDNTACGGFLDKRAVLQALGRPGDLLGRFRQIHLVSGNTVFLDVFGNQARQVDVSRTYEIDYANWVADQVERLRTRGSDSVDWDHLAEELESLGRSERKALRSHLQNLLHHLLKWQFQPGKRTTSWTLSIRNARSEVHELLLEEPSLKASLLQGIVRAYDLARRSAAAETGVPESVFPTVCPYGKEQIVDPEFFPGAETATGHEVKP